MNDQPLAERLTSCGMTVKQRLVLDMAMAHFHKGYAADPQWDRDMREISEKMDTLSRVADAILSHPVFETEAHRVPRDHIDIQDVARRLNPPHDLSQWQRLKASGDC